jgi:gliding motility-associated-like protein
MRSILLFACLCIIGDLWGQGSGFSFSYTGPTQINVGASCMAPLNWGAPATPTCTSNIPGGIIVYFDVYSISGGYHINDPVHGGTTVTIFYQAIDNFGNNALFGFTIAFTDNIPPVFDPLSLPPNITLSCSSNLPVPAMVEATDNCADVDPPLTITYTQTGTVPPCGGGTITRKWVADDDLGNKATFTQTITIVADVTPPVITNNLQNGTATCANAMAQYTTWLTTQRANFTATDAGCGVMTKSDNAPPPSQITSFCGAIDVTFTAKDNCNNTSTVIKTFTITNNVAPVIHNPASDGSGNCGQPNIAQIFNTWINTHGGATATDDCSSIFWTTYPPNPSIGDTCNAAIPVMFIAGDGCNNFDTTSANFILIDNTGPTITMQPTTVVVGCSTPNIDSLLMDWLVKGGNSKAHDLCTADNELQLGYKINGTELSLQEVLDVWQDSLAAGCKDGVIINGLGINNVKGVIKVQFTYADKCDNEGSATAFFGVTDNGKPVFDTLPSNQTYVCSDSLSWMQVLTNWYESAGNAAYSDLCSEVTVLPSITLDSAIAVLTAALDTACMQGAFVTIQFGLQDECGNTSLLTPSATFSLQDTLPPGFTHFASDLIGDCGQSTQTQLQNWLDTLAGASAVDGCGDVMWSFSWVDTAGMIQSGIPFTGPYPQVGDLGCNAAIDIFFTVTDLCQNAAFDTASFMVIDTIGPVFNIITDTIFLSCTDTIPTSQPDVSDVCDPNPSVTYQDSVGVDTCVGHPGFVLRTWTAIDACGNSTTAQVWFLSADTIPPTFNLPSNSVSFCSIDTLILLNVADNCDPSPDVTWNDVITGMTCTQILNRTWIVTDACGNSATAVQQFDLSDTSPPVIEYSPGNFVFSCDTSFSSLQDAYEQWMDSVVISDGCSASAYFIAQSGSYVLEDTTTWPGLPLPDSIMVMCGSAMTIVGDLVAYDVCGNVVVEQISFSVHDTVPPAFINCIPVIEILPDSSCTGLVSLAAPGYEEICFPDDVKLEYLLDGGDTISIDTGFTLDTILRVGIHNMVWIATDCNGNAGTCETSIRIIDENAISLICQADTLVFVSKENCTDSIYVHVPITTLGACGLGAEFWHGYVTGTADPDTFTFSSESDSILIAFGAGIQQVYLIVADSTGDIDTCNFIVEVRDTFPPDIICQNDTLYLSPSGSVPVQVSTSNLVVSATDACGIETITYDPATVGCAMNGQNVNVTITVTDHNGNSSTCTSTLFVTIPPLSPGWERGLCDDTLHLFSHLPLDTAAHYTFTWFGPNAFTSFDENPVIPNSDTSFSGTYTVVVLSAFGCVSMGTVNVTIQDLVSPVIAASEDTLCAGEEVILTSQVFSGNVMYQWYQVGNFGDLLLGQTSDPQFTHLLTDPITYAFYAVILADTCMSAPGPTITVDVEPVPLAAIADLPGILCITDSLFLSPANIVDTLKYVWSGPGGYTSSAATPPGIPASDIDSSGTYTLLVSSQYCSSVLDSIFIQVQQPPATPSITGDAQACEGGTITLHATPGADHYDWITPASTVIASTDPTLAVANVAMNSAGNWQVISYIHGCPSDTSAAFAVQIDTAISIQIITTERVCEGENITLTVSPASTGTFTWNGPGGFTSNEIAPTTLAQSGVYAVQLVTTTGCEASDVVDVLVDALPVIDSLVTDADSCADGTSSIHIWAITHPLYNTGFEYHWEGSGSFAVQDSSIVFTHATADINGVYSLFIVNGTCTSAAEGISLNLTNTPAKPVIIGDNVYCHGDSIILSIDSPVLNGLYAWSSNDTSVVLPSPGTLILPDASFNQNGIYHVSVSVNGCTSATSNFALQVKPALLPAEISGTSFVCEGDSLILQSNAPAGAISLWSGPNGFESLSDRPFIFPSSVTDTGNYFVTYELNGCHAPVSAPFHVAIQAHLTMPLINADVTSLCIDAPIPVNICLDPTSTTPNGLYTWILNATTPIDLPSTDSCILFMGAPLQVGINSITAIATLQGCPSDTSNTITIIGDATPEQNADAGPAEIICPGQTIMLNGSDPFPGNGVWTTNDPLVIFQDETDPKTEILPLPSGMYTFYWTLSYATCFDYSTDSVSVTLINSPLAAPDTVDVPFGQTVEFDVLPNDSLFGQPFMLQIGTNPQKGNAVYAGNGKFRYTPNIGFVGTDRMTYILCSQDCPEECSETTVILHVGNESDCFVPTLFTPNGDGINDELIVPCLETSKYPNNKIIIFNEWGAVIYTKSPYENDWDGTYHGESLPVGTYFYIMDFGDGNTPKRSFLVLER